MREPILVKPSCDNLQFWRQQNWINLRTENVLFVKFSSQSRKQTEVHLDPPWSVPMVLITCNWAKFRWHNLLWVQVDCFKTRKVGTKSHFPEFLKLESYIWILDHLESFTMRAIWPALLSLKTWLRCKLTGNHILFWSQQNWRAVFSSDLSKSALKIQVRVNETQCSLTSICLDWWSKLYVNWKLRYLDCLFCLTACLSQK